MMASKFTKVSVLKAVARKYSAQAAVKPTTSSLQVSKTRAGAVVVTANHEDAVSRVAIFVRAGSRHETVPGISYMQRICSTAALSNAHRTGYDVNVTAEHNGVEIMATNDRETLLYAMRGYRDKIHDTLSSLAHVSSNNEIRHYEFPSRDQSFRLEALMDEVTNEDRALDLLGKAAFRNQPLGNTILPPAPYLATFFRSVKSAHPLHDTDYLPTYDYSKYSFEAMNAFVSATHGSKGLVVVGSGIDHDELLREADAFGLADGGVAAPGEGTKYFGGDLREESLSSMCSVVVAGPGAKNGGPECMASRVAAYVLGNAAGMKYGAHSISPLIRAAKGAPGVTVRGVSQRFVDTGLFGFHVTAPSALAPTVVSAMTSAAKNLTASDAEISVAKKHLKAEILESASGCSQVCDIGNQFLLLGGYTSLNDRLNAVDAVTPALVNGVIAKAFSSKLTVVAVGDVTNVPYSDQL